MSGATKRLGSLNLVQNLVATSSADSPSSISICSTTPSAISTAISRSTLSASMEEFPGNSILRQSVLDQLAAIRNGHKGVAIYLLCLSGLLMTNTAACQNLARRKRHVVYGPAPSDALRIWRLPVTSRGKRKEAELMFSCST